MEPLDEENAEVPLAMCKDFQAAAMGGRQKLILETLQQIKARHAGADLGLPADETTAEAVTETEADQQALK